MILERGRERREVGGRERGDEREMCHSTYLHTHWLVPVCALTGDQAPDLGILG